METARSLGAVLGLDTGGGFAGLAIVNQGRLQIAVSRPVDSQCANVPEMVGELMAAGGLSLADLAGIAVGIGPGSFTGLRIGLSYAKGVAMATGCGIAGISRLDAMALAAVDDPLASNAEFICPLIDAHRGELYGALYRKADGGVHKQSVEFILRPEDLAEKIAGNVILVGHGIVTQLKVICELMGQRAAVLDSPAISSPAPAIAALGAARLALGEADRAIDLQPSYLRKPYVSVEPRPAAQADPVTEVLWSGEKKSSSSSTFPAMKN